MSGAKKTSIFKRFLSYVDLLKKCNSLENEVETLKEIIKSNLFDTLMKNLNQEVENKKQKQEIKQLRKKIKTLKEIIKSEKR